jgi:hypothetical protein
MMLYNSKRLVKDLYMMQLTDQAATQKGTLMPPPCRYIRRGTTQKYFMKPEKKEI